MIASFQVPGSSSNLGPGFDAMSMAMQLYLQVKITPDDRKGLHISATGVDSEKIPTGSDNLILRVINSISKQRGHATGSALLTIHNNIPLARGLGSSAAAIIAGITSYEMLAQEQLEIEEIFKYAQEFETHLDNLAAALFGGLIIAANNEDGKPVFAQIPIHKGIVPVIVIPEFELSTEDARKVLPNRYSRADVVFNVQRSALLIAALSSGKWHFLTEAMQDRIHQPYRTKLIPGLESVLQIKQDGLFGVALSGAGPTVLALAAPKAAESVGQSIVETFAKENIAAKAQICFIDTSGRFSEDHRISIEL